MVFESSTFARARALTRASEKLSARALASGLYGARGEGGCAVVLSARGGHPMPPESSQVRLCAKSVCAEQLPEASENKLLFFSGRVDFPELKKSF